MAGRNDYAEILQGRELKEAQDRIANSLSQLNRMVEDEVNRSQQQRKWVLNATLTLTGLQRRLELEQEARRLAERQKEALKEEVERLRRLLQQERREEALKEEIERLRRLLQQERRNNRQLPQIVATRCQQERNYMYSTGNGQAENYKFP